MINLAVKKRKKNRIVDNDVTMVNETIAAVVNSCLIKKNKRKYNEKERESYQQQQAFESNHISKKAAMTCQTRKVKV